MWGTPRSVPGPAPSSFRRDPATLTRLPLAAAPDAALTAYLAQRAIVPQRPGVPYIAERFEIDASAIDLVPREFAQAHRVWDAIENVLTGEFSLASARTASG